MLDRLKNPIFILALASLIYRILKECGIEIDFSMFQSFVDIISYVLIGAGVYKSFEKRK